MSHRVFQQAVLSLLLIGPFGLLQAATLTVTNLEDSGNGSLRAVIEDAGPGDTIVFQQGLSGTITLQSPLPDLDKDLVIEGPGAEWITVSGSNQFRVFFIDFGATVTISGLSIADGLADVAGEEFGGGIRNLGNLTLRECVVRDSFAEFGGGISNEGALQVQRSTIAGNFTSQFGAGGGIENFAGSVTVVESTIYANSSGFGGGIENADGDLVVLNSTVSGNSAAEGGGGIDNFGGEVTLVFGTVTGNAAISGGGVLNEGQFIAKNSLAVNSPTGGDCDNLGSFASQGANLATDGTCPGFMQVSSEALALGPLGDNGGPTLTHALGKESAAVDEASDCSDDQGEAVTTDQRGVPRPQGAASNNQRGVPRAQGAACDIGAFERAQSTGPPQVATTPERLDFGDQPLGQPTDPMMVVVENTGGDDLIIGVLSILGMQAADYAIVSDACSNEAVPGSGACGFEVVFTAGAAGVRTARVRIPSNADSSPDFVDLVGSHDVIFVDGFEGN